jgi:glycogen synthase
MKTVFLTVLLATTTSYSMTNPQPKTWTFSYKAAKSQTFQIKKSATTYEEAYKSAAKDCFKQMTQGKYPGEDRGLDIIDICANPKS